MADVSCEYANSLLEQLEKAERELDSMTAGRDAALELAADLARERDDDSPPACDNCEAVMDGHMAATSDVCLDCWNRSHDAESEVARLTEQVTQLTRERDQIKVRLAVSRGCRKVAQSEVSRLTEALAAERRATGAEADIEEGREPLEAARAIRSELVRVHDELLAAERDRDAANALLRRWMVNHSATWLANYEATRAHLFARKLTVPRCQ